MADRKPFCSIVVRLLFDCCSISNRTTIEQQRYINGITEPSFINQNRKETIIYEKDKKTDGVDAER